MKNWFSIFVFFLTIPSCTDYNESAPKPHAYPKVDYPKGSYKVVNTQDCDFEFEIPDYVKIIKDSLYFDKAAPDCWFNIIYPKLKANLHCSYYPITNLKQIEKMGNDAFVLANKHTTKADFIDEIEIHKPNNVHGYAFSIEGNVASPFQFFLTDSTQHYFRGSLYFDTKTEVDSIGPILNFVKTDIMHMINTFNWNTN